MFAMKKYAACPHLRPQQQNREHVSRGGRCFGDHEFLWPGHRLQGPFVGLWRAAEIRCGQGLFCLCHFSGAGMLCKEIFGIAIIPDYK